MSDNVEAPKRAVLKLKRNKSVEAETNLGPVVKTKPKPKRIVKELEPEAKPVEKVDEAETKTEETKKSEPEVKPKEDVKNSGERKFKPLQYPKPPSKELWRHLSEDDKGRAIKLGKKSYRKARDIWPTLFNWDNPKPFKIGMFHDLNEENQLKHHELHNAFWYFCTFCKPYKTALAPGATRYDKNGNPDGIVTGHESTYLGRKALKEAKSEETLDKGVSGVNT